MYTFKTTVCPICNKEFSEKRKNCECGFGQLKREYDLDELYFRAFKFAKRVFRGMIEYPADKITDAEERWFFGDGGKKRKELWVDRLEGERGLAVLDFNTPLPIYVRDGLFAFQYGVMAAILNAEYIDSALNEESALKILFLGPKFMGFRHGNMYQFNRLKYIEVHRDNPCYSSRGNALFDKKFKRFCLYPGGRKDEEYTVPPTVKVIGDHAFSSPDHLKKLRLPEGVRLETYALFRCEGLQVEYYKK